MKKKLFGIAVVLLGLCLLSGCGSQKKQARKVAIQYIEEKYGFTPHSGMAHKLSPPDVNRECYQVNMVTLNYPFSVIVGPDMAMENCIDDYQKYEIRELWGKKLYDSLGQFDSYTMYLFSDYCSLNPEMWEYDNFAHDYFDGSNFTKVYADYGYQVNYIILEPVDLKDVDPMKLVDEFAGDLASEGGSITINIYSFEDKYAFTNSYYAAAKKGTYLTPQEIKENLPTIYDAVCFRYQSKGPGNTICYSNPSWGYEYSYDTDSKREFTLE